jgi:hypothetical protein
VRLACLWRNRASRSKLANCSHPVYGWFTEGFDTRDLKEAKALLEDLGCLALPP